ncbi:MULTISPECIES: fibronectin type III domain-containing protein [Acinetobacter]|uniref:hypothetical protein n=1 Tax=Acinetobacter TaxID=469 RepID=UPI000EA003B0|nr:MULTISPECIES: hypothetical protein [Acinetobacter]RKG43824.1 hypothetical protein D7V51_09170 [Acinetobacter cumulans]RZG59539.1 hypothetical protein EXE29_07990 [Acinetobacter sp. WCHAc060006]
MSEEKGIRLEFAQFGHFDSFEVFRSLTSMIGLADHELPAPIATGLKTMRFIDQINLKSVLDRDLYYRVRVIRGNQSLLSDELQTYISTFSAPQNLIVAFSNNALEIEWDFESVTELHYYCSEFPIDINNLPLPKAVIAGNVRTYVDTDIDIGKTYYICIGSVKNGVEKISDEITVSTGDAYFNDVDLLIVADTEANSYIDHSNNARTITKRGSMWLEMHDGKKCIRFDGYASQPANNSVNGCLISAISALSTGDYTIEIVAAYPAAQTGGARLWEIGTENANRTAILPTVTGYNGELLLNNSTKASYSNIYFDGILRNHTLMRKNGVTAYYVDGVNITQTTDTINITVDRITIGAALVFNGPLLGWVHALRITNAARYSETGFTPDSEFQKF